MKTNENHSRRVMLLGIFRSRGGGCLLLNIALGSVSISMSEILGIFTGSRMWRRQTVRLYRTSGSRERSLPSLGSCPCRHQAYCCRCFQQSDRRTVCAGHFIPGFHTVCRTCDARRIQLRDEKHTSDGNGRRCIYRRNGGHALCHLGFQKSEKYIDAADHRADGRICLQCRDQHALRAGR